MAAVAHILRAEVHIHRQAVVPILAEFPTQDNSTASEAAAFADLERAHWKHDGTPQDQAQGIHGEADSATLEGGVDSSTRTDHDGNSPQADVFAVDEKVAEAAAPLVAAMF